MSTEESKAIARRFGEVWNGGDLSVIDELAAPDLVVSYPLLPEPLHGPEAFKQFLTQLYAAFSDVSCSFDEVIGERDKVAVHWTFQFRHTGDRPGFPPPTGRTVRQTGITIYNIVNGKVASEVGEEDALSFMRQIGLIPMPDQVKAAA